MQTTNRIDYRGSFWFPVTPDQLWATIERFDLFESWWAWLDDFQADNGGLVDGTMLHGMVVPPVPWRLHLEVRLVRCDRPRLIEADVDGDVHGDAALRLEQAAEGTHATAAWSLRMNSTPLRVAVRAAHPLMQWGHDRVVDMTVSSFRQRALSADGSPPVQGPLA